MDGHASPAYRRSRYGSSSAHDDVVLRGEFRNGLAAVGGQRDARRILERRDGVKQLWVILEHRFFELFRDNPVLVALYRHQRCLIQPHTLHVAQK